MWIFIAIAILALPIVTLLIIKKKSPKTYNSFINWIKYSLPEYIRRALDFIVMAIIVYACFAVISS